MPRFNRFILDGDHKEDDPMDGTDRYELVQSVSRAAFIDADRTSKNGKSKGKAKEEHIFQLTDDIHAAESLVLGEHKAVHKYEVCIRFVILIIAV